MKFALIQLSDIHIRDREGVVSIAENPVLLRGAIIAKAVNSVCFGVRHNIIVISGDTAFSGKETEYYQGQKLIENIRDGLDPALKNDSFEVLTIAGNHDCDFSLGTSIRKIVLDSLKPDNIDNAVIAQVTDVQKHYHAFAAKFDVMSSKPILSTVTDKLYVQRLIKIGTKNILLHLFNSAWVSQLHEKPGGLYFPVVKIKDQVVNAPAADISIAVVHHPFNWYWPENAREFRTLLEDNADLILTGHEHVSGVFEKKTDTGEQNEYLEGGVLQETGQPDISSFNVVIFDVERGQQQTHRFVWKDNRYSPIGESYWRPFERNKRLTRSQFEFSKGHFNWLMDAGATYTHPHKDPVVLDDIFVYPDMREIDHERESVDQAVIRSRDVVTFIMNSGRTIIVSEEKAGKTTLTKSLVKDLHRNGKVPLTVEGESLKNFVDADRMKKEIDAKLLTQYSGSNPVVFWQLDHAQRAVVVDDFHKLGNNRKVREDVVSLLCERFGIVVLIAGEEYRVQELASDESTASVLADFKQCNVLQFGLALRHSLIAKWYRLGRDYADSDNAIGKEIKRAEDQLSNIISSDFLPSFPVFILILLQQLESSNKLTTTSGSFGYLYEVLVTDSLSRRKATRDEMDTLYTYLSEYAYHLFVLRRRALIEDRVREWHENHCRDYRLPLTDFRAVFDELAAAGVIDTSRGDYRFRYKYLYYFFVARYFRDNINKPGIQDSISNLSRRLHHEDSANIIIFLCHLSKDERVLNAMLSASRELFADSERFDINKQTAFLNRANEELPKLALHDGDPTENRRRELEKQDSEARKSDVNRQEEPAEIDDSVDEQNDLSRLNAAIKTIQILGQVLKNFSGSLKGDPKRQLVEECYGLGLRCLGYVFKSIEESLPLYAKIVARHAQAKQKTQSDADFHNHMRRLFSGLLRMFTYSIFKHVSDSVGTEKLAPTFAEVNLDNENTSVKIIDLAIRLDYFDMFPRPQLEDVAREFSNNFFAMSLVRIFVWNHLYLFPVDYRIKQFACEKAKISVDAQTKIIASDTKKTASPRDSTLRENDKKEREKKKEKRKQANKSKRRGK